MSFPDPVTPRERLQRSCGLVRSSLAKVTASTSLLAEPARRRRTPPRPPGQRRFAGDTARSAEPASIAALDHCGGAGPRRLLAALGPLLGDGRAGVTIFDDGLPCGTWVATDDRFADVDDLQITFGEGPGLDAHRSGAVVSEDLGHAGARWPAFAPAALDRGVAAVLAVPLTHGRARLGVLTVYGHAPVDVARRSAEIRRARREVTRLLAAELSDAPPGALPPALDAAVESHAVVYAATGAVAAQLAVAADTALSAIRMRAWSTGRGIHELSADIVAGTIRFDAGGEKP